MYISKALCSSSAEKRNTRPMQQYGADYADIPINNRNWGECWCTLPKRFETVIENIINFEVRNDDVFVITYMKCGTTWMQEAAWLLLNNLDFEGAKEELRKRSPFLEFNGLLKSDLDTIVLAKNCPSPRLLKSHLPANLLPKQLWEKRVKIIYVARNLKDMVCSSYHFQTKRGLWKGNMDEYIEDFTNNDLQYAPFWETVVDFWKMRNEPYIFFTTYEEMKRDLPSVLQRLSKFLGKPELSAEQLQKVAKHLSFDQMKANENFKFMRRGIVGSFKDELTAEQCNHLDDWTKDILDKYDIKEAQIFGTL